MLLYVIITLKYELKLLIILTVNVTIKYDQPLCSVQQWLGTRNKAYLKDIRGECYCASISRI